MGRKSLAMAALLVLAAACGTEGAPEAARAYCEAVERANQRGEQIFGDVDMNDDAAREAAEAEMYEAVQEVGLVESAPEEIRDDVRTFVEGTFGPQDETYDEAEVRAAEERVLAYEEEHCEQS